MPEWMTPIIAQGPMVALCVWVIVTKDKQLEKSQDNFTKISEALNKILGALGRRSE